MTNPERTANRHTQEDGERRDSRKRKKHHRKDAHAQDSYGDRDEYGDGRTNKGSKSGKVLTIVAIILGIFVAGELIALGVQYLAPESGAAKVIDNITNGFDKDGDSQGEEAVGGITLSSDPDAAASTSTPSPLDMDQVVAKQSEKHSNSNILQVTADSGLTFDTGEDYGFDEFPNTYIFDNKVWYTDDNGNDVSYADEMVKALISYYSDYIISDANTKASAKSKTVEDTRVISNLAIGEIRAGGAGFYVRTAITIADNAAAAGASTDASAVASAASASGTSDGASSSTGTATGTTTSGTASSGSNGSAGTAAANSGTTVKNQLVYLEPSNESMTVITLKDI
jgi:hypothetical protein